MNPERHKPGGSTRNKGPLPLPVLALALLLHGGLLLIPLATPERPSAPPELITVTLVAPPVPDIPEPVIPVSEVQPEPVAATPPPLTPEQQPVPTAPQPLPVQEPPPLEVVTRTRLLEEVAEMEWTEPATTSSTISRPVESDLYARLIKPVMALYANEFDDAMLPTSTEIVDRWKDAAGVHQVVIRTVTGDTLCGRQEPVNEFRPWTQMPMMFNKCAGGGKRTFKTPEWRNSPSRR